MYARKCQRTACVFLVPVFSWDAYYADLLILISASSVLFAGSRAIKTAALQDMNWAPGDYKCLSLVCGGTMGFWMSDSTRVHERKWDSSNRPPLFGICFECRSRPIGWLCVGASQWGLQRGWVWKKVPASSLCVWLFWQFGSCCLRSDAGSSFSIAFKI